jgi:hypothetical protein
VLITGKSKKRGRPFQVAALFLENDVYFQYGSGHLAQVKNDTPRRTFRFGSELKY